VDRRSAATRGWATCASRRAHGHRSQSETITDAERFLTGEDERPRVDLTLPFRDARAEGRGGVRARVHRGIPRTSPRSSRATVPGNRARPTAPSRAS